MTDKKICTKCGTELPFNAPAGVCPRCLLHAGLLESSPEIANAAIDATILTDSTAPSNRANEQPTVGEVETLKATPRTGEKLRYFGEYELLVEIARGGMGVVYRARQVRLNRIVALKMILAGQFASKADVQRFHTEAEAAAQLDHPGIVPIYEVGEYEGHHFFTMGFVDGGSLAARLQDGPLAPRDAALLVQQVAAAVQFAHERGVIHRDLKPANILLDRAGQPRITDFGLARNTRNDSGLTASGQVMGTPGYMPPEQASGNANLVKETADVYSLGAILYALLTGRPPFQADNVMDTLMQVIEREPVAPSALNARVPRDLETICLKSLEKDRRGRYASARELAEELQRFLEGRPILALPVSAPERAWRWCRRHPAIAALTTAIAASLIIGTLVSWSYAMQAARQARDARRSEEIAVTEKKRADEQAATRLLEQSLVTCEYVDPSHGLLWLTRSLEEASRINATELEQSIRSQLGAWSRDLHPLHAILPHPQTVLAAAFEPDGKTLVTVSANPGVNSAVSEVLRWDAATGKQLGTSVKQEHASIITAVALTPDGRLLVTGSFDQTAQLWSVATGERIGPPLPHQGPIVTVAISPDGKAVLTSSDERGKTCLWKLGEGEPECTLLKLPYYARTAVFSPDGKTLLTGDQSDNSVQLWNIETGEPVGVPFKHQSPVHAVTFSPDGRTAAVASGKEVQFWNAETHERQGQSLVSTIEITSIVFSPDGKLLAVGDSAFARLWEVQTRQPRGLPLRLMEGLSSTGEGIACMAFSPDGRRMVAGGASFSARMWDLVPAMSLGLSLPHQDQIRAAVFSPDGKFAATGSNDRTARIWNAETGEAVGPPLQHEGIVWSVAFSPDGTKLLTAGNDKTARLWDVATGQLIGPILQHPDFVRTVAFTPDGKTFLTASSDVQFWDVETGKPVGTPLKHPFSVQSMLLSPDGKTLATSVAFSPVQLWDVETRTPLGSPLSHGQDGPENIGPVAFTPDSRIIFTAGQDNAIRLWDVKTGMLLNTKIDRTGGVNVWKLRPDGKVLLTGNYDGAAQLWDLQTGKSLSPPMMHPGGVFAVAYHPDGRFIVTGCADSRPSGRNTGGSTVGETRLWDSVTGKMLGAPMRHPVVVNQVAFSPDGTRVLTGGADRFARLWRIPTPVKGTPDQVTNWAQVITGLELQDGGSIRALDANTLEARRTSLEQLRTL